MHCSWRCIDAPPCGIHPSTVNYVREEDVCGRGQNGGSQGAAGWSTQSMLFWLETYALVSLLSSSPRPSVKRQAGS